MSIRRRSHSPVYVEDALPRFLQGGPAVGESARATPSCALPKKTPARNEPAARAVPLSHAIAPPVSLPAAVPTDHPHRRMGDAPLPRARALVAIPSSPAPDVWFYLRLIGTAVVLNVVLVLALNPQQHRWNEPPRLQMAPSTDESATEADTTLEERVVTYSRLGDWTESSSRP